MLSDMTGTISSVISKAASYRNFQKEVGRNMGRVADRDGE